MDTYVKRPNVVREKSLAFAIKMVELSKSLQEQREFVLSKQLLRSGTSIGALVREAEQAESSKDFIHKLSIGLKEANETDYWLELLFRTNYITEREWEQYHQLNLELIRLLVSIIKTSKSNNRNI